jgi:hypothetical protein
MARRRVRPIVAVCALLICAFASLGGCSEDRVSPAGSDLIQTSASSDPALAPDEPQRKAGKLRPKPSRATKDKSRMFYDNCQIGAREVRNKRCIYGARKGRRSVVLFGDSHALMYFPALNRLAKRKGWRLVALAKVGCPPFDQLVYNRRVGRGYRECLRWHRYVLRRLDKGNPNLIVTSGWIWHKAMRKGRIVPRASERNRRLLRKGYVSMLRKLRRRTGAKLAVMKDVPKAPHRIPPCVSRNRQSLDRCAFTIPDSHERQSFERAVVQEVKGARLVDLSPVFCPDRLCHAVIRDRLVYRDNNHLTATYSGVLWRQLEARLPRP